LKKKRLLRLHPRTKSRQRSQSQMMELSKITLPSLQRVNIMHPANPSTVD
jgi:hypothetical protein